MTTTEIAGLSGLALPRISAPVMHDIALASIAAVRGVLGIHAHSEGPSWQQYRDRWSKLCRALCDERGRPHLTVV